MKYITSSMAIIIIGLLITIYILSNKLENTILKLNLEKTNNITLMSSIQTQNEAIKKLELQSDAYKKQYERALSEKNNEQLKQVESKLVNSCQDILELIENLK